MIDTVLFDLDNTLLDFNKAERKALTSALRQAGVEPSEEMLRRYSVLNLAQWKLLEQGKLTREEVKVRRYELLFQEYGITASAAETAGIYEKYLGIGHYFIEGAEELLQELFTDYRLYLVTNGTASVQKGRLESSDMGKYFQGIFISEDIGFCKPSREYFHCCFARIPDFHKENTVIVGDSLTSDIQGGINAGIRTIWFHPGNQEGEPGIVPDYEIRNLKELPGLLQHIV